jgi:glucose-1-phosphate thymidylyltransferase
MTAGAQIQDGAMVFAYQVSDPERYGVVEFDSEGKAISLEEKPDHPKSSFAVPGVYFYDRNVTMYAESLKPSARNEIEITDLNRIYLEMGKLVVSPLGRGVAWLDAGTHQSLLQAANFVQAVEDRQGLMISCPEEIAYRKGFITRDQMAALAHQMGQNTYSQYLIKLLETE